MAQEKIRVTFIFEILGKPANYIKEMTGKLIEKIQSEQGIAIKNKRVNEPKEIKDSKGIFTTFSEIEAEFDSILHLMGIVFAYMPAHLEIVYPENLKMSNFDLNSFFNDLIRKLHQYDEIVKRNTLERNIMEQRLVKIIQMLKEGKAKEVEIDLDKFIGIIDETKKRKKQDKESEKEKLKHKNKIKKKK